MEENQQPSAERPTVLNNGQCLSTSAYLPSEKNLELFRTMPINEWVERLCKQESPEFKIYPRAIVSIKNIKKRSHPLARYPRGTTSASKAFNDNFVRHLFVFRFETKEQPVSNEIKYHWGLLWVEKFGKDFCFYVWDPRPPTQQAWTNRDPDSRVHFYRMLFRCAYEKRGIDPSKMHVFPLNGWQQGETCNINLFMKVEMMSKLTKAKFEGGKIWDYCSNDGIKCLNHPQSCQFTCPITPVAPIFTNLDEVEPEAEADFSQGGAFSSFSELPKKTAASFPELPEPSVSCEN
jgi:hypothetical protein